MRAPKNFSREAGPFLTVLRPLLRFMERVDQGALDMERPKAEIRKLERQMKAASKKVSRAQLQTSLEAIFRAASTAHLDHQIGKGEPLPRPARVRLLCRYFEAIDKQVPFASTFIGGGSPMNSIEWFEATMLTSAKFGCAASLRGERRAELLRELVEEVGERFYNEVVTILYEVERVRRNEPIVQRLPFGNRLEAVVGWTRTHLPGFLDADAARLRNAAVHRHWRYDLATDTVHLHDGSKWKTSIRLGALYHRAKRLYLDALAVQRALMWRSSTGYAQLFGEPPLALIFDRRTHDDPVRGAEVNAEIKAKLDSMFIPTRRQLASLSWCPRYMRKPLTRSSA